MSGPLPRHRARYKLLLAALCVLAVGLLSTTAQAQAPLQAQDVGDAVRNVALPNLDEWFGPERLTNTMLLFLLLTVLSLAPAIVIMTTSFVRIIIVLSITRQALGTQALPPSSVLTTIALFMTFHIMSPVFTEMYQGAVVPYTEGRTSANELVTGLLGPMRSFMAQQIENTGNHDDVWLFLDFSDIDADQVQTYEDVPLSVLLPAYMLSEVRTAFLIGFQLFLPFLIIDMAIASVLVSMGMMMLPPVLISLPFKLLLFVLVDGWALIANMLITSFSASELSAAGVL